MENARGASVERLSGSATRRPVVNVTPGTRFCSFLSRGVLTPEISSEAVAGTDLVRGYDLTVY